MSGPWPGCAHCGEPSAHRIDTDVPGGRHTTYACPEHLITVAAAWESRRAGVRLVMARTVAEAENA